MPARKKSEAKKRGIGMRTLHYLRKSAESEVSFRVYAKNVRKLVASDPTAKR